ncbi:SAYSvFN domain-containing protein 1 [Trichinella pseudospiralis]|uniref:SAYSvFN domain-containing protein 1 n=1 Tax=Trichinella pseudospiralis TaxID=6337 RepID=A0A0V1E0S3_TRIPS|nr:SAYSvFN domain-containing protein 1 [Trichinella pseudospiralis]KRZ13635.1 SAYSvFN domain-containing protein 1 [Trichinella pseudospiralis]KRZ42102.1 SAYSvFN domain-containing protein 1 [Trichinella pseudospiralis]
MKNLRNRLDNFRKSTLQELNSNVNNGKDKKKILGTKLTNNETTGHRKIEDEEEDDDEEEEEEEMQENVPFINRLQYALQIFFVWLILLTVAVWIEFGCVYALLSCFVFIWYNTSSRRRKKRGELSAYSVFNPECTRLPGQLTAEHFEDAIRSGGFL